MEGDDLKNRVSAIAAKFIHVTAQSGIPVLSYFCELRSGERLRPGNSSSDLQGLIALSYALLRQMIEILLPRFETTVDLSEERFRRLEGTAETWDDLMKAIESLVGLMPDRIFRIVDGLHWIDDASTERYMQDLIGILRKAKFWVLFTTTGRAPCLPGGGESPLLKHTPSRLPLFRKQ